MEESVSKWQSLLALERETEVTESESLLSVGHLQNAKELEAKGVCIQRLHVASQKVGLYGRQVVNFELATRTRGGNKQQQQLLPSNSITPGDIVGVLSGGRPLEERKLSGVVTRSSQNTLSVAFDDLSDSLNLSSHNGSLQLVRLANDVTYRRIRNVLESLQSNTRGPAHHLVDTLFGEAPLGQTHPQTDLGEQGDSEATSSFHFFNPSLDPSQRRAVVSALSRPDVAVIHGPPGTGKTTTVLEVILQAVRRKQKVLVCAPSNIAVDNIVEQLGQTQAKVVRIGHPARLVESVLRYSLDALLSACDSAQIMEDVTKDLEKALSRCSSSHSSSERRRWRSEVKTLRKELQHRQRKSVKELLTSADVVLATTTGASLEGPLGCLPEDHFDVVVIDECAQALEASCWIPLLRAPKCVLAGDHKQLPPTILSQEAADKGLSVTMMERLVELYGSDITSMLTVQYRMHEKIMSWPSVALYDSQLVAHHTVAKHLLCDLPGVAGTRETSVPLVFIDTAGCDLNELDTPDEESKGNEGEADVVCHHLKSLLAAGVAMKDIAVIAPYNLQVHLIRQRLPSLGPNHSHLEVRSVDGFQGREKEAVVISFTRSNKKGVFGFLKEQRRTNVAVTRARRHLALIGDSVTISQEPFIKGLIDHCHKEGDVWSAHDHLHDSEFEESHHYKPKLRPPQSKQPEKQVSTTSGRGKRRQKEGKAMAATQLSCYDETESLNDVDVEERRAQLKAHLEEFISQDRERVMSFPSSFSGNERKIVHELCEQLDLIHVSKGQGMERYIQVDKKSADAVPCAKIDSKVDDLGETQSSQEGQVYKICLECGKPVLASNLEQHQVHCEKLIKQSSASAVSTSKDTGRKTSPESTKQSSKGQQSATKKKGKKTSASNSGKVASDDLDTMLAETTLVDSTCSFTGCKKSVNLLGMQCRFCKLRYCMAHNVTEVHGCEDAAKKFARQQLSKELKVGSRPRSVNPAKRAQLQRKLDKKIDDMSRERKPQKDVVGAGK